MQTQTAANGKATDYGNIEVENQILSALGKVFSEEVIGIWVGKTNSSCGIIRMTYLQDNHIERIAKAGFVITSIIPTRKGQMEVHIQRGSA